jgi:pyruvate formate lyase activating enzyme
MTPAVSLGLALQKFSIHDGPGIRTTVFFKGCPLRCSWCHNPESQSYRAELLHDAEKCTQCLRCLPHCPQQAITAAATTDRILCRACGDCIDHCLQDARQIAGRPLYPAELLPQLLADQVFYEQSGGGVTFSGGEPLSHIGVLEALAQECKRHRLHVCVDTCGHAPVESFRRSLRFTDLFLFDLKHMDPAKHRLHAGQDNQLILANLRLLSDSGANIFLRLPLIEGINDDSENIAATLAFAQTLRLRQVNLLPYHATGRSKYARLDRADETDEQLSPPIPDRLEEIRRQFAAAGFDTHIGG